MQLGNQMTLQMLLAVPFKGNTVQWVHRHQFSLTFSHTHFLLIKAHLLYWPNQHHAVVHIQNSHSNSVT